MQSFLGNSAPIILLVFFSFVLLGKDKISFEVKKIFSLKKSWKSIDATRN